MLKRNGRLLYKRFSSYFLPTVLTTTALSLSNVLNGVIVGNMLGEDALAVVNLCLPLPQAMAMLYCAFGVGGSIMASYHKGRRDNAAADKAFSSSLAGLLLASLAFMLAGLAFREEIALLLCGGNPELARPVSEYIGPLLWGCPFMLIPPGLGYFVRADGRPRLAAGMLIMANGVGIGCGMLYICLLNSARGASLGMVTGYAAGSLVLLAYARSKRRGLHALPITPRDFAADNLAGIKAALPIIVFMILQFLKIFLLNILVLAVAGKSGMVAFSVCLSCLALASVFMSGASQTLIPIVSALFGEKDYTGIRFIFRRALAVMLCASGLLCVGLEIFAAPLMGLFGVSAPEDVASGVNSVRLFALCLPGMAFSFLVISYAQTIRRQGLAIVVAVIEGFAVLIPAAFIMSRLWGLTGIWLSFSVAEAAAIAAVMLAARRISAKSGGEIKGLLMLPEKADKAAVLDVTIGNTVEEAVQLSELVIGFGRESGLEPGLAMRAGMIVEEMAVNVACHGGNAPGSTCLDIAVAVDRDEVCVTLRDDGRPFNPVEYSASHARAKPYTGLPLIGKMASRMEYAYALGFNTTLVALGRQH